jgi:pimeloyl-ACP methyl ester carboxylesterase
MITGRRFSPWLKERDQIIFEQRGTKYSQPALDCPEVSEALIASAKLQISEADTLRNELGAVRRCRVRLSGQGVDLASYNSKESAADIEDLRRALDLDQINLYGVSYSARLMLEVMRDYPAHIRSVVLESTLPLEINYDEVGVDAIARVLNLLFSECSKDASCSSTYPTLERDFAQLVQTSNAKPFIVNVKDPTTGQDVGIKLSGHDIVTWLADYVLSSNGRDISAGPFKIYQLIRGDRTSLIDYASSKLSPSFYSLGMRYSVWCHEEMPFENRRKIAEQRRLHQILNGYVVQTLPDICAVWKVPPATRVENLPVKNNIPTLILAGQYDAYTPPAWGQSTARNLKNSFYFEVPWVGHGPGFNSPACLNDMVAMFFDNPMARPDSACLDRIRTSFKFKVN